MAGRRRACLAVLAALAASCAVAARAETLLVFAAASLGGALDEAARGFEAATGHRVRVSYGPSSALARQVEAGAPAHLFISADLDWMRHVEARGLLAGAPVVPLSNELVLVAPAGRAPKLAIAPGFALAAALGAGGRLAIANPETVPAGKYAKAALQSLGAWPSVQGRLAPAENARAAVALVARGEAPLGIAYRTDALATPGVAVVGAFPAGSHPPIAYPLAVIRGAPRAAHDLARHLAAPGTRAVWRRHGFTFPS